MFAKPVSVAHILPELDPTGATALSEQVARFYARAIEDGRVLVGERLPPIREVANACSVTRATVQEGYRRLADLGLVEGTVGRGTIVLAGRDAVADPKGRTLSPYAEAALRRTRSMRGAPSLPAAQKLVANFAELAPDDTRFPIGE